MKEKDKELLKSLFQKQTNIDEPKNFSFWVDMLDEFMAHKGSPQKISKESILDTLNQYDINEVLSTLFELNGIDETTVDDESLLWTLLMTSDEDKLNLVKILEVDISDTIH